MMFPKQTEVNKRIPKQKFYDNLDLTPAVKKAFVEQIQSVVWKNKLSPATINLRAGQEVTEIEVFEVSLNTDTLDEAVLRQIDRQIPYHILFCLCFDGRIRFAVGHKEAAGSGGNAFRVNRYFFSEWMEEDEATVSIDGLDMDSVWEGFIAQIGSIQIEDGNTLDEQIAANAQREKIEKEIARLEKLARKESQPKKKFELVQKINGLKNQL